MPELRRAAIAVVVFDLDGCLLDTEELIRAAYRDAGHDPPPGFMALGHHDWIPGDNAYRARVHAAKNAAYLNLLAGCPSIAALLLPPWVAAVVLRSEGLPVAVMTGAPAGTIDVIRRRVIRRGVLSWPFTAAADGLDPAAKTVWLAALGRAGTLVDDQLYVTVPAGWRVIRYTAQTALELCRLVTC